MSATTISSKLKEVSNFEELRAVLNETAKDRGISLIDTSKFGKITSAKNYLEETIHIAEYVKKRGIGLYWVEKFNLYAEFWNNKEVLKELKENEVVLACAGKALKMADDPTPKDEFFRFTTPSLTPENILKIFAVQEKEMADFFRVPLSSGARSVLDKN